MKLVEAGALTVGVYNCAGRVFGIEDRCPPADGPLCEGEWEPEACVVVCPRHGSRFDLESGIPMSLPAFEAVPAFPGSVREGGGLGAGGRRGRRRGSRLMRAGRVLGVLARLEADDAAEREAGLPAGQRSRQVE